MARWLKRLVHRGLLCRRGHHRVLPCDRSVIMGSRSRCSRASRPHLFLVPNSRQRGCWDPQDDNAPAKDQAETGRYLGVGLYPVGDHGRGPCGSRGRPRRPRSRARRRGSARSDPTRIHTRLPTGPAARDAGFARSPPRCEPEPGAGQPQRPALRRPTPDPERPAPPARSDRARAQPVPGTVATCRNTVALLREAPAPDHRRPPLLGSVNLCLQALTPRGRVVGADDPAAVNMRSLRRVG